VEQLLNVSRRAIRSGTMMTLSPASCADLMPLGESSMAKQHSGAVPMAETGEKVDLRVGLAFLDLVPGNDGTKIGEQSGVLQIPGGARSARGRGEADFDAVLP
jgi:hypothetical protein